MSKSEIGLQVPGTVIYVEVTQSPESIFLRIFDLSREVEIHREMMPKVGVVPPPPPPRPDPPDDGESRYGFDMGT